MGLSCLACGVTHQRAGAQLVGDVERAVEGGLLELRRQLVVTMFGTDVDVVEHAVDQRVVGVDDGVLHAHAVGRGAEVRRLEEDLVTLGVEFRVGEIEVQGEAIIGRPLQRAGEAEAILLMLVVVVARNARHESGIELRQRRRAGVAGRETGEVAVGAGRAPAHRARALVDQPAVGVGSGKQRTELAVGPGIAYQHRGARIHLVAKVVVLALSRDDEVESLVGRTGARYAGRPSHPANLPRGRPVQTCARRWN